MPQRRRRKRTGTCTTPNLPVADARNKVWAVDFQFDATTDGRPIKIATVVDEDTRECLAACVVIADWKENCNTRRRHSSLGYQAPAVYAATCTHR